MNKYEKVALLPFDFDKDDRYELSAIPVCAGKTAGITQLKKKLEIDNYRKECIQRADYRLKMYLMNWRFLTKELRNKVKILAFNYDKNIWLKPNSELEGSNKWLKKRRKLLIRRAYANVES